VRIGWRDLSPLLTSSPISWRLRERTKPRPSAKPFPPNAVHAKNIMSQTIVTSVIKRLVRRVPLVAKILDSERRTFTNAAAPIGTCNLVGSILCPPSREASHNAVWTGDSDHQPPLSGLP